MMHMRYAQLAGEEFPLWRLSIVWFNYQAIIAGPHRFTTYLLALRISLSSISILSSLLPLIFVVLSALTSFETSSLLRQGC